MLPFVIRSCACVKSVIRCPIYAMGPHEACLSGIMVDSKRFFLRFLAAVPPVLLAVQFWVVSDQWDAESGVYSCEGVHAHRCQRRPEQVVPLWLYVAFSFLDWGLTWAWVTRRESARRISSSLPYVLAALLAIVHWSNWYQYDAGFRWWSVACLLLVGAVVNAVLDGISHVNVGSQAPPVEYVRLNARVGLYAS